jgi:hypothetical protein
VLLAGELKAVTVTDSAEQKQLLQQAARINQ